MPSRGCSGRRDTHIRFHDLRHTHATLMLKAGVHPKIVQERLGHSSVAFTMDVYSHVVPGLQENAAQRFDQLILLESLDENNVGKPPKLAQARNGGGMLANGSLHVGKMFGFYPEEVDITGGFEREPRMTRTSNRLIKRDKPYLLSDTNYSHPISDIRKYSRDLCLTFHLLLSSIAKYVGKMLATALHLRRSSN